MTGRIWDGQSMAFDEAYQILMDLSILTDPGKGDLGKNKGQNPRAGWFNKYLQTGKSDHETKNNGAFGGLNVPMVGSTWVGNLHPIPGIELLQGKRGDHGCMAKARLFIGTGGVIQPHQTTDLDGMEVSYMWIEIPEEVSAWVLHSHIFDISTDMHVPDCLYIRYMFAVGLYPPSITRLV